MAIRPRVRHNEAKPRRGGALRAVRMVFWAQLRHRWRSWLAIAILISVVGGVVMAAAAAGRRTESAFPAFVAAHGFDADVYATQPAPKIPRLPEVSSATVAFGPDNGQPTCACTHPHQPLGLRCGGPARQGKTGLQARVGPLAGPVEPRPGAGLVHPAAGRRRAPGDRHPRPLLRPVAVVGVQQRRRGLHPNPRVRRSPSGWSGSKPPSSSSLPAPPPRTACTPLKRSPAPCSRRWRRATCTSSASVTARPTFPDSTLPASALGGTAYHAKRGCPGRIGRSVDPSPGHRVVDPGRAGRTGRPGGHRPGAGPPEHRRERGLSDDGGPGRRTPTAGHARHGAEPGGGAGGCSRGRGGRHRSSPRSPRSARRASLRPRPASHFDTLVLSLGALGHSGGGACSRPLAGRAGGAYAPGPTTGSLAARPSAVAGHLSATGAPPSAVIGVRNALERRSGGASRSGGQRPARHRAGGDRAVRDGGLRRQPVASDGHAQAVRRPVPAQYLEPRRRRDPDPALFRASSTTSAVTGITQGIALPAISVNKVVVAPSPARPSEVRSSSRRSTGISRRRADRSASARRRCARWAPIWVRSSRSRCRWPRAADEPCRSGWSLRCPSRCSAMP